MRLYPKSKPGLSRRTTLVGAAFAVGLVTVAAPAMAEDIKIGLIPKFTSDPYFVAAQ